jgi:hypothetical protein
MLMNMSGISAQSKRHGSSVVDSSAKAILSRLGVSEVNNPPAASTTSTLGTAQSIDPSAWQPLKKSSTVFSPRAEVFQMGCLDGSSYNSVFEDGASSSPYADSHPIGGDQAWAQGSAKTSVCADIDGDGLDEILVFYVKSATDTNLYFRVGKNGAFTAESTVTGLTMSGQSFNNWFSTDASLWPIVFPYLSCAKLSRVSTNSSGVVVSKDEILLADYETAYILAVDDTGSASIVSSKTYPRPVSCVAAGDVNGDGNDEILVGLAAAVSGSASRSSGAQYAIYESDFGSPITSPELATLDSTGLWVEAVFGDFEGDNLDQLALCCISTTAQGQAQVHMFDFSFTKSSISMNSQSNLITVPTSPLGVFRMLPRAVNLDGKGFDYLEIAGLFYKSPMSDTSVSESLLSNGSSAAGIIDTRVGDVDNDAMEDLTFLLIEQNGSLAIVACGLNSGNAFIIKKVLLQNSSPGTLAVNGPTIAMGNIEDNSARVHYVGHTLTFTDPIVIAVLASPPYWSEVASADSGYAGAYPGWVTTFGETSSHETDTSASVGFSVGFTLSFEHELTAPVFGVKLSKFTAETSFSMATNWQWTTSYNVSKSIQWNCPGGEDEVVFASVPMDEYQYQIDYSNDPTDNPVGKSLYISIPRPFAIHQVTRDYFNASIGSGVIPPIDGAVLGHTLGQPKSYPTSAQKDALLATYFPNDSGAQADYQYAAQPVGQGSNNAPSAGSTNLQIVVTSGASKTFGQDFSNDTSIGAGIGDFSATFDAGFSTSYSATTSTSSGTSFGGTVGFLPTSYYANPNYSYSAGLFAYPYALANGKRFWVVDYWVQ